MRKIVELTRRVPQMVDCLIKGDSEGAQQLYMEIRRLSEEVDQKRRVIMDELTDVGAILTSREDFMRFVNVVHEIADFCEGAAFRITEILDRKWKVPKDVKDDIAEMADAMLETVLRLREVNAVLGYNANATAEKASDVEAAERAADELYRKLELKIISSKIDIPTMLLLREVAQFMEDAADKAEDAANAARVLALSL
ncbi:hypothetical protein DRO48_00330 [Candidatus Bathyarchaeota archaeon]|nr:MAG: hypothetical protein DRO48_00330 [Candidatus Bathyarchaeota archaeon]